jgi:serine/threonine protein kinase
MEDAVINPEDLRSLADKMVLKRTRSTQQYGDATGNHEAGRYMSVMAELQILTHPSVAEHENIIDLLGLTWDFEINPDGTESVWPVLALEAAECSMETLMHDLRDAPAASKIKYCHDIAKALEFLHARGVVHCDVKSENVLICVNSFSGSVAKLSDFGSALLDITSDSNFAHGIVGTRPWNAPEYGKRLKGLDVMKTDVFSFGMLLWRFIGQPPIVDQLLTSREGERDVLMGQLEEMKRNNSLVGFALEDIERYCASSLDLESLVTIIRNTLGFKPSERWSMTDLKVVLDDLVPQSIHTSDGSDHEIDEELDEPRNPSASPNNAEISGFPFADVDEDDRIFPIPSVPFYNDVGLKT